MRFVSYYPRAIADRSGVTAALWGWAAALADAGHEVDVLHHGYQATAAELPSPRPGLSHQVVPSRGLGRMTTRPIGLASFLAPDDILLLHDGWVPSNVVAARTARRLGTRYVVVPHGAYEPGIMAMLRRPRAIRRRFEREMLEGATAVHVFFESEAPLVRAVAPGVRSFVVAPIGHDLSPDRWRGDGTYLAWMGRYDPNHKGLTELLQGLALIEPRARPSLRLRGPDYKGGYARTLGLIDELGLAADVDVGGPVYGRDKVEFLCGARGFVMPSRWESYGIALVENLAMGVPCLVAASMHVARTLQPTQAAVIAAGTAIGMADGIRRLLEHDPGMGERGRAVVRDQFAWPKVVTSFLEGLEENL